MYNRYVRNDSRRISTGSRPANRKRQHISNLSAAREKCSEHPSTASFSQIMEKLKLDDLDTGDLLLLAILFLLFRDGEDEELLLALGLLLIL